MASENLMTVEELNGLLGANRSSQAPKAETSRQPSLQPQQPMSAEELNSLVAPKQQPSVGFREDAVRSIGSGLSQGAMGLVGIPGAVEGLGRAGAQYLGYNVGSEPVLPTTEKIKGFVESNPTVKSLTSYEPVHAPNRYLKTAAEFLPGAVIGPGGLALKAAGSLGAGVATQATEDFLKGTPAQGTGYETALKLAASIPGYMLGSKALSTAKSVGAGSIMPGREAEKRIAEAMRGDVIAGGKYGAPMTPQQAMATGADIAPAAIAGKRTENLIQGAAGRVDESLQGAFTNAGEAARLRAPINVSDDIDRMFNSNVNPFDRNELLAREAAQVNSANYQSLMASPKAQSVFAPALSRVVSRIPEPELFNKVGKTLVMFGDDPAAMGMIKSRGSWVMNPNQPAHLRVWDQLKKELDSQIGSLKDPVTGRVTDATRFSGLNKINSDLKTQLDLVVPQYANVRGAAAEYAGAQNAIELGMKYLKEKDPSVVRNMESIFNGTQRGKTLTPEQKEDFAYGMVGSLKRMMTESDKTANDAFRMFTGPGSKETIRRFETALQPLGPDVAQSFVGRAIAESLNRQVHAFKPQPGFNLKSSIVPTLGGIAGAATQLGENLLMFNMGALNSSTLMSALVGLGGGKLFNAKEARVAARVLEYASDPKQMARLAQLVKDDPNARTFLGKVQSTLSSGAKFPAGVSASMSDGQPQQQASGGRVGRASGGRLNGASKADMIIAQVDRARKELQRETGSLLNHDDSTIVKALKVANERI